jgi:predicted DsbA family dithiol-disulfide isomerase
MRQRTFNSRRAQELGKWAEAMGRGDEFHRAVFHAYFVESLNIAKISVLTRLVESIELDGAEAERVLAQGSFKAAVDSDWANSRAGGITAVPTFVAGGRGVVGAQSHEVLKQLVETAGAVQKGDSSLELP